MRKLLILKSLEHVGVERKGISYHKFTVRMMEDMLELQSKVVKPAGNTG